MSKSHNDMVASTIIDPLVLINPDIIRKPTQSQKQLSRKISKLPVRKTQKKKLLKKLRQWYNIPQHHRQSNINNFLDHLHSLTIASPRTSPRISTSLTPRLSEKIQSLGHIEQLITNTTASSTQPVMILLYTHGIYRKVCYVQEADEWYSLERGHSPIHPFTLYMIAGTCETKSNRDQIQNIRIGKNKECIGRECNTLINLSKNDNDIGKSEFGVTCQLEQLPPLIKEIDDDDDDDVDKYASLIGGMPDKEVGPNNFIPDLTEDKDDFLDDLNVCSIIGTVPLRKTVSMFFPGHIFVDAKFMAYCMHTFLMAIVIDRNPIYKSSQLLETEIIINPDNNRISEILIIDKKGRMVNVMEYKKAKQFFSCSIIFEPNDNLFYGMLLTIYQYLWIINKTVTKSNSLSLQIPIQELIGEQVHSIISDNIEEDIVPILTTSHIEYYEEYYDKMFDSSYTHPSRMQFPKSPIYTKSNTQIVVPEWTWTGILENSTIEFHCCALHEAPDVINPRLMKMLIVFQASSIYKMSTISSFCDNQAGCFLIDSTCSYSKKSYTLEDNEIKQGSIVDFTKESKRVFGGYGSTENSSIRQFRKTIKIKNR